MSNRNGNLFIISAPSGAGKTSLVTAVVDSRRNVRVSVSHTTRLPRPEEKSGRNYFFISKQKFKLMDEAGDFVEQANVFGNLYGTSREEIRRSINNGNDLILEIDWQGAAKIRSSDQPILDIFILPPSIDSLQSRLTKRGQDNRETINFRMSKALNEISHYEEFTYLIVNDHFETALSEIQDILDGKGERLLLEIQKERYKDLILELTTKKC
ncbi:MAG: guanylate kinase [Candidatus Azotimanducaceae bacterium]|uniref:Guanylate kinase n=1 Tax=OM182 bacterium TaxID=2510334 RepID=A0A520S5G2_9GAMM|nr:guanylate kinase [Gammaproteobacteria bacterium]OUV68699.1 MAG: guanylate kinase [Gammaproteobacteria bacterium TMED133]RZO77701.1 MAG: guanylate kinase [OM182 bacterium]